MCLFTDMSINLLVKMSQVILVEVEEVVVEDGGVVHVEVSGHGRGTHLIVKTIKMRAKKVNDIVCVVCSYDVCVQSNKKMMKSYQMILERDHCQQKIILTRYRKER